MAYPARGMVAMGTNALTDNEIPEADVIPIGMTPEAEFEAVFAHEKRRLYQVAYSVLRDQGDAEDAVQDTMWVAWKSWSSLRDETKRAAWLTRICLNTCFRSRRKLVRMTPAETNETGDIDSAWRSGTPVMRATGNAEGTPAMMAGTTSDVDLDRAFLRLPTKQRAAVLLHYHYGYTVEQCGELMGCRSGTVRTHVQRALASLREDLREEQGR